MTEEDDAKTTLASNSDAPTQFVGRGREAPGQRLAWPGRDRSARSLDPPTRPLAQPAMPQAGMPDDRTRLVGLHKRAPAAESADRPSARRKSAAGEDPVVGWLVVVEGEGKGRSVEIGFGANSIGRDASQRLCLDFGDKHISRERHALIVFDPRGGKFFLQGGDVRNLTYLDDQAVIQPVELVGGETILIGETKLRFVPLCGPDFSWT